MHNTRIRSISVLGILTVVIVITAPAATAAGSPAEETAGLIAKVAPNQGDVLTGALIFDTVVSDIGDTTVTVPLDPAQPITLDGPGQSSSLAVHLPTEVNTRDATITEDGTMVYLASDDGACAAVQALTDGSVRIQTITPDADGPHEFTYTFDENTIVVEGDDGAVELLEDYGSFAMTVGEVGDAWAVDANGNEVETTYRIEDNTLIQEIVPGVDTTYPIVADPTVTRAWWNTTVYFSLKETGVMAAGAGTAAALAQLLPPPFGVAVSAGLGVGAGVAGMAHAAGRCLKAVFPLHKPPIVWLPYWGGEAGGYCR